MPTNDFIGFASAGSANVMSQVDYAAAAEQGNGVQPGMASSKLANKAWRQGANMAAALGRITAARGYDALDNGDLDALQSSVDDAVSVGTFNKMFFSQTSGTFIAPRTGVYRITLKGGGGGGGYYGGSNSAGGGGEGGMLVFYETLTKNTSYQYTIGAGGGGGVASTSTAPTAGGNSTFNNGAYSVDGGAVGYVNGGTSGGSGGRNFVVPSGKTAYFVPGAPGGWGTPGAVQSPNGGGQGGGFRVTASANGYKTGVYGGGGQGGGTSQYPNGGSGGAGFILIEYAG